MTIFGPVDFRRSRYRPSGRGEAMLPVEATIGLTVCKLTPAAAGLSMYFMSSLTARESEEVWKKRCRILWNLGHEPLNAIEITLAGNAKHDQTNQKQLTKGASGYLISSYLIRKHSSYDIGKCARAAPAKATPSRFQLIKPMILVRSAST